MVYLEEKHIRKPIKFAYRLLTLLRFKNCGLNKGTSKVNYLLELSLTRAAQSFVEMKHHPFGAKSKAVKT